MLAREIMMPEPFVAAAGATSAEVALLMRAKDISVVPVVDNPKDRRYLGTISDRDIVTQCVAAGHDPTDCQALEHARSEEHTSELQSPDTISYAVFCLKKKNKQKRDEAGTVHLQEKKKT